jgi:hypothetical protein
MGGTKEGENPKQDQESREEEEKERKGVGVQRELDGLEVASNLDVGALLARNVDLRAGLGPETLDGLALGSDDPGAVVLEVEGKGTRKGDVSLEAASERSERRGKQEEESGETYKADWGRPAKTPSLEAWA